MLNRPEIDHRTTKLIVGIIALGLPVLTSLFASQPLQSISASFYETSNSGWSQIIFIGFLFAIAAFLLAYNGRSTSEMCMSKLAAVAALGVALFRCRCVCHNELVPHVHALSATTMFLVLTYFCFAFLKRARDKKHIQALARAIIYALCAIAMLLSVAVLAIEAWPGETPFRHIARLTFYGETTGLVAFGVSWLTASLTLPILTRPDERFSPLRNDNPPDIA